MEFKNYSFAKNAALSFLSALLLVLALPYYGWTSLVWVAIVPFFIEIRRARSMSSALTLSAIFAVTYCVAVVAPLLELTTPWWIGGLSVAQDSFIEWFIVCIAAVYGSLPFLFVAYISRKFQSSSMRDALSMAIVWSLCEYVRAQFMLLGYGWGVVGYSVVDMPHISGIARVIGVYGLSFLVVLVNMVIVLFYEHVSGWSFLTIKNTLRSFFSPAEKYWTFTIIAILLLCVMFVVSDKVYPAASLTTPMSVATIVTNSDDLSVGGGLYRAYRKEILALLAAHKETNIILFPENVFPFFVLDEETGSLSTYQTVQLNERDKLYEDFIELMKEYPSTVFAVGLHTIKQEKKYNTLVFYQDGQITGLLHKQKLVPFFEYAPLGLPIPLFERLASGGSDEGIVLLGSNVSLLMCSEISDDKITPSSTKLILSPSNDGVFANDLVGRIHGTFARMRAMETGAYVVRANKGSVSSIITPDGRVVGVNSGDGVLFQVIR